MTTPRAERGVHDAPSLQCAGCHLRSDGELLRRPPPHGAYARCPRCGTVNRVMPGPAGQALAELAPPEFELPQHLLDYETYSWHEDSILEHIMELGITPTQYSELRQEYMTEPWAAVVGVSLEGYLEARIATDANGRRVVVASPYRDFGPKDGLSGRGSS